MTEAPPHQGSTVAPLVIDTPAGESPSSVRADAERIEAACRAIAAQIHRLASMPGSDREALTWAECGDLVIRLASMKADVIRAEDMRRLAEAASAGLAGIEDLLDDPRGAIEPETRTGLAAGLNRLQSRLIDLPFALHRRTAWQECLDELRRIPGAA